MSGERRTPAALAGVCGTARRFGKRLYLRYLHLTVEGCFGTLRSGPGRVARLRRLLGQAAQCPAGAQSADRRRRRGRAEGGAVLQDRQAAARPPERQGMTGRRPPPAAVAAPSRGTATRP